MRRQPTSCPAMGSSLVRSPNDDLTHQLIDDNPCKFLTYQNFHGWNPGKGDWQGLKGGSVVRNMSFTYYPGA